MVLINSKSNKFPLNVNEEKSIPHPKPPGLIYGIGVRILVFFTNLSLPFANLWNKIFGDRKVGYETQDKKHIHFGDIRGRVFDKENPPMDIQNQHSIQLQAKEDLKEA